MTVADLKDLCLTMPGSTYDFPFDNKTAVFRVGGKMFALMGINSDRPRINLKCDPELARGLREAFEGITPGFHMNKEHWNTVDCASDVPTDKIEWLIGHSFELVRNKLPKSKRPGI